MKRHVLPFCLGVGVTAVLFAGGAALAQSTTPTPTPSPASAASTFLGHLADRLGIQQDTLTQAMKDAAKDTVDDAVKAGRITADQGQKLKDRIDQGTGPLPFGGFKLPFGPGGRHELTDTEGPFGPGGRRDLTDTEGPRGGRRDLTATPGADILGAAANAIGISPAELKAQLGQGKTIDQIATDHGKDPATVHAAIRAALQPLVDSGRITSDQADKIAQNLDPKLGLPFGPKGPGGRGRGGHGPGQPAPSPKPSPSPTS